MDVGEYCMWDKMIYRERVEFYQHTWTNVAFSGFEFNHLT